MAVIGCAKTVAFLLVVAQWVAEPATADTGEPENEWESLGFDTGVDMAPTRPVERPFGIIDDEGASPSQKDADTALRDLEKRALTLRGQIQDLRSEILMLGEQISKGFVTGTKLLIIHRNRLGSAFAIEAVEYKLDGFSIYSNTDARKIAAAPEMVIFDASVLPGSHSLDVIYTVRATGYGVFTYMKEYTFEIRNQYHFATPKGKALEMTVEAADRGVGTNLRDRPYLNFVVR